MSINSPFYTFDIKMIPVLWESEGLLISCLITVTDSSLSNLSLGFLTHLRVPAGMNSLDIQWQKLDVLVPCGSTSSFLAQLRPVNVSPLPGH